MCSNAIGTCSIGTERLNQPWVSSTGSVSSVVAIQGTKRFSVMLLLILEENWWVLLLFEFFVGCFFLFTFVLFQVRRKIDLIYGGGSVGLMGLVSKTVHDGGCHVLG